MRGRKSSAICRHSRDLYQPASTSLSSITRSIKSKTNYSYIPSEFIHAVQLLDPLLLVSNFSLARSFGQAVQITSKMSRQSTMHAWKYSYPLVSSIWVTVKPKVESVLGTVRFTALSCCILQKIASCKTNISDHSLLLRMYSMQGHKVIWARTRETTFGFRGH